MKSTGNNLLDRIYKLSEHVRINQNPGWETNLKKLNRIREDVENGFILGAPEFVFLDSIQPRILGKCKYMSPLGNCNAGIMEWCSHRGDWERGFCKCKKYFERT